MKVGDGAAKSTKATRVGGGVTKLAKVGAGSEKTAAKVGAGGEKTAARAGSKPARGGSDGAPPAKSAVGKRRGRAIAGGQRQIV